MPVITKKLDNPKFNLETTMRLIQEDNKLRRFFTEEYGDNFEHTITLIKTKKKEKGLDGKAMGEYVKMMFNEIICAEDVYKEKYSKLDEPFSSVITPIVRPVIPQAIIPTPVVEPVPATKTVAVSKTVNIKRRIPLSEIKAEANKRGNMTENERAMIAGYELKNIVARIHNRGKQGLFTDEEARDVIATIETVKKKLNPIFNKK